MTRYQAPQGKQVVIAALALVLGVALFALDAPASDATSGGDSFYTGGGGINKGGGSGGGLPNPGPDGEADPDWWQTDTWIGSPIGEAPTARQLPTVTLYRPYGGTGFGAILTWMLHWTAGWFGIGRLGF